MGNNSAFLHPLLPTRHAPLLAHRTTYAGRTMDEILGASLILSIHADICLGELFILCRSVSNIPHWNRFDRIPHGQSKRCAEY